MSRALDPAWLRLERWPSLVERILAPAAHYLCDLPAPSAWTPLTLLPGVLDEPLLLAEGGGGRALLSNACSHRGHLLCKQPAEGRLLRCPYHGRRFDGQGRLLSSPGFAERPSGEDLPRANHAELGPMLYASLGGPPAWLEEVQGLLAALPLDRARAQGGPDYVVEAHFLLWLENYLEGLHIPFVHPALARSLDLGRYRQRQTSWGTVQVGVGEAGSPGLPLPVGHPDRASADEVIAGYYLYIFPGIALNLYPWGLSLNAIWPEGPARTRVVYRRYVWAPELCGTGAGGDLHQVELEDDAAVESVQRGLRSRLYRPGRLHPTEEAGLLWLHDRLEEAMRG